MKAIPAPLGLSDKNDAELKKQVLKMNIKSEQGWIYFNELLYRILRKQYGSFKLNKKMQIRELVTQFKLFTLTMEKIKAQKHELDQRFLRKVGAGGKDSVNPFLTHMYLRMSFITWLNAAKKHQKMLELARVRAIRHDRRTAFGLMQDDYDDLPNIVSDRDDEGYEDVEIDVDVFSEWTATDEDEPEDNEVVENDR